MLSLLKSSNPLADILICASQIDSMFIGKFGAKQNPDELASTYTTLFNQIVKHHEPAKAHEYSKSKCFSVISVFATQEVEEIKETFVHKVVTLVETKIDPLMQDKLFQLQTVCEELLELFHTSVDVELKAVQQLKNQYEDINKDIVVACKSFEAEAEALVLHHAEEKRTEILEQLFSKDYSSLLGKGETEFRKQVLEDIQKLFCTSLLPVVAELRARYMNKFEQAEERAAPYAKDKLKTWAKLHAIEFKAESNLSLTLLGMCSKERNICRQGCFCSFQSALVF